MMIILIFGMVLLRNTQKQHILYMNYYKMLMMHVLHPHNLYYQKLVWFSSIMG